jgi:hypothetical protein
MSTDIIAPEPMIIDEPPVEEARVPEEHIEHTQDEAEEPTVALLRLTEVWRTDRLFTIINEQTTDDCTIRAVINALRAQSSVNGLSHFPGPVDAPPPATYTRTSGSILFASLAATCILCTVRAPSAHESSASSAACACRVQRPTRYSQPELTVAYRVADWRTTSVSHALGVHT